MYMLEWMCFHMCGHSCVGTHVHVVHLCGGPGLVLEIFLSCCSTLFFWDRVSLKNGLELSTPSKSLASLLQAGAPASTFPGWSSRLVVMSTWHLHGVRASELPSSCLHVRTPASKPSSHPCIFYLRENLPTQFTKPENQEPSPAVHSRGRFKDTKRLTPGINSVSCTLHCQTGK